MAEKDNTIGILVGVIISLVVGLALIGAIADQVVSKTQLAGATETVNLVPARNVTTGGVVPGIALSLVKPVEARTGWRADNSECIVQTITFKNQTGGTITNGTDYIYSNAGTLTLLQTTNINGTGNVTTASFSYCPDGYQTGFGRTIMNMIPGFFALALLGIAIMLVIWVMRKQGLDIV